MEDLGVVKATYPAIIFALFMREPYFSTKTRKFPLKPKHNAASQWKTKAVFDTIISLDFVGEE